MQHRSKQPAPMLSGGMRTLEASPRCMDEIVLTKLGRQTSSAGVPGGKPRTTPAPLLAVSNCDPMSCCAFARDP